MNKISTWCNTKLLYLTLYHSCSSWSENSVFSLRSCSISGLSLLFCFPMVTSLCVCTTPGSDLLTKETHQLGHKARWLISRDDQTCGQKRGLITAWVPGTDTWSCHKGILNIIDVTQLCLHQSATMQIQSWNNPTDLEVLYWCQACFMKITLLLTHPLYHLSCTAWSLFPKDPVLEAIQSIAS